MKQLLAFTAVMTVVAAGVRADGTSKELQRLQGIWAIESWQEGGKEQQADDQSKKVTFVVKDDTLTFKHEGQPKALVMRLKLDPSANPKAVDLISTLGDRPQVAKGIYERKGDELKLIWARNGQARPAEFETKRGDDRIFVTLRLVRTKDPAK
jgi:uncharacterized protein (TIGR03067 family)